MKKCNVMVISVAALALLAGCGHSTGDRALSGGGIGAGVGAVGGALMGVDPVGAALVGGAVGAGVGAVTSDRDINLGRPAWR